MLLTYICNILYIYCIVDDFMKRRELIEIWNLSNRYKEEIQLCQSDMDSFIKATDYTIKVLKEDQLKYKVQLNNDAGLSPPFEV